MEYRESFARPQELGGLPVEEDQLELVVERAFDGRMRRGFACDWY